MKYTIDFQKEYKTSEHITEVIYVVVIDHNHYHNRPFIFTKEVHPSSYTDVEGMVEEWNCGCYYTREFKAEVTIDDVIKAFVNDQPVCKAYYSNTKSVEEVYFDHD